MGNLNRNPTGYRGEYKDEIDENNRGSGTGTLP